jgi:hypothetical protein
MKVFSSFTRGRDRFFEKPDVFYTVMLVPDVGIRIAPKGTRTAPFRAIPRMSFEPPEGERAR